MKAELVLDAARVNERRLAHVAGSELMGSLAKCRERATRPPGVG
jgi:hypothetical protein